MQIGDHVAEGITADEALSVIVKVSDVCNLNCSYCYYYAPSPVPRSRGSPFMSIEVAHSVARYVANALSRHQFGKATIILHGGEPLLCGTRHIAAICAAMVDQLPADRFEFCLQTNAVDVDDRWIDLFSRYDIRVGVSIDGPEAGNDARRTDHAGRGSYRSARRGIDQLMAAANAGRIHSIGALVVVDPLQDAEAVYHHIVHGIGLRHIDFLLPDPIAGQPVGDAGAYARCFRELLRAWLEDRPAEVRVRLFDSIVGLLTSGTTRLSGFGRTPDPAMTISVDGDIFTDDVLRSTEPRYFATGLHVDSSTIDEYLASEAFLLLKRASEALPDDCLTCDAAHACRGGQLVHRYRKGNGFANRSLYCDSLYALFCLAAEELLRSDRTAALLMSRLAERAAPAPAAFA